MVTFKQLEAIFWVVQAGGFAQAALRLHTTQSAVSKRVQELEQLFNTKLFDRGTRTARLTEKGEEMFLLAKKLLAERDAAMEQFTQPDAMQRRIRIGVTELSAMTWLPRLVNQIHEHYPRVVIEPEVDMSTKLRDKLLADELDLMVVPDAYTDARFASKVVGTVENAWMCKPGLLNAQRPIQIHELAARRVLVDKSGTGIIYDSWFKSIGFRPVNVIVSNSIVALIALTISGFGVSYFPKDCLRQMQSAGLLDVLEVNPPLPDATYVAMYKSDQRSTLIAAIVMLAQECCDFSTIFQTA
ncbi:LysR family transcriptional regulator [Cupriavidus basilensis]|uniref:LysR family transcriptional regulator n=1 Tax=Cupriavidus basilensis TaxID=68895 RepID=UPI0023E78A81|nr:LysR family transcriptional regulator [Cupriavidus basilensis]MDF3881626.1 LysR family transcriptional regulator [Cupriavidus basilensis]